MVMVLSSCCLSLSLSFRRRRSRPKQRQGRLRWGQERWNKAWRRDKSPIHISVVCCDVWDPRGFDKERYNGGAMLKEVWGWCYVRRRKLRGWWCGKSMDRTWGRETMVALWMEKKADGITTIVAVTGENCRENEQGCWWWEIKEKGVVWWRTDGDGGREERERGKEK